MKKLANIIAAPFIIALALNGGAQASPQVADTSVAATSQTVNAAEHPAGRSGVFLLLLPALFRLLSAVWHRQRYLGCPAFRSKNG